MQNQTLQEFVENLNNEFIAIIGGSYVKLDTGERFSQQELDCYQAEKLDKFKSDTNLAINQEFNKIGLNSKKRLINDNSTKTYRKNKKKLLSGRSEHKNDDFNRVYRKNIMEVANMLLDKNEKLTYLSIRDFVVYPSNCVQLNGEVPSIKQLLPLVGLSDRKVKECLKSLEEKGLIKRINSGHRKAIYINPEYYSSGVNLDNFTLKLFNLIELDEDKVREYLEI